MLRAVEICAGAGGQSLGLHLAGFAHDRAVELDRTAADTLTANLARLHGTTYDHVAEEVVRIGDVADADLWDPATHEGVDLLAGGVPCPPFSVAGRQLGASDERDLFAWAVELTSRIRPKAVLLENVRGLAGQRFSGYRQAVADRLDELGYWSEWRLLHAAEHGVPQLRPRFVLVALAREYGAYFAWPDTTPTTATVGTTLRDLMASRGWAGADAWAAGADTIAPTIVGGSKRHGGADLGPTRAKQAWAKLGVDAWGVADEPPPADSAPAFVPKLTCEMVARLQGWQGERFFWEFRGLKTSRYRQIGNAFPPPMALAVGRSIANALDKVRPESDTVGTSDRIAVHDPVYRVLRSAEEYLTVADIAARSDQRLDALAVRRHVDALQADFVIEVVDVLGEPAYRLVEFKAFTGQLDHRRHEVFDAARAKIS